MSTAREDEERTVIRRVLYNDAAESRRELDDWKRSIGRRAQLLKAGPAMSYAGARTADLTEIQGGLAPEICWIHLNPADLCPLNPTEIHEICWRHLLYVSRKFSISSI